MSDELPSYNDVLNGDCLILSGPSSFDTSISSFKAQELCVKSPIHDIPFQLNSTIQTLLELDTILKSVDLIAETFNSDKYSYNFSNERSCLRELDGDSLRHSISPPTAISEHFLQNSQQNGGDNIDLMSFS